MPINKNQEFQLTIDNISSDGNGVGRHEGMAIFVPNAAAGDTLLVRIVKSAKNYAFGRIVQVLSPGPGRQEPDCPSSGICGGCSFRHLSYPAELEAKHTFVADAMARLGKLDFSPAEILPSPAEDRYRNKVQYPVVAGDDGKISYGFYATRSHRVVPCQDCLLQTKDTNLLAQSIVELLQQQGATAYDESTKTGLVRHITLRQGVYSGQILVCLVLNGRNLPDNKTFTEQLCAAWPQVTTIVLNTNQENTNVIHGKKSRPIFGGGTIEDTLCGVPALLNEHTFAQVNTPAAERLFSLVREYAAPQEDTTVLDLYCGTGVIGLSMARQCKSLIGVEAVSEAVESARHSAEKMGLSNTRFLCADAAEAAGQLAKEGTTPDVVVMDPPRKGVSPETLLAVLEMSPSRIVMVSCNPATLARDLAALTASGYAIKKLQPVDLFPRTKHVECVCLLERI